jgi:oligoribonuclease NrnB/cAMP/cGMP phosphodiesterase (DHH superfamily)
MKYINELGTLLKGDETVVLMSHADVDGAVSQAMMCKYLKSKGCRNIRKYLAPAGRRAESVLYEIALRRPGPIVVVTDISIDYDKFINHFSLLAAIDHHVTDEVDKRKESNRNVLIVYARPSESTASIIDELLYKEDPYLVQITSEVDSCQLKTEDSHTLYNYAQYLCLDSETYVDFLDRLGSFADEIAKDGFNIRDFLKGVENTAKEYESMAEGTALGIKPEVFASAGKTCAIFPTTKQVFATSILNMLNKKGAKYDVVVLVKHLPKRLLAVSQEGKTVTKIDVRTSTKQDIRGIAKLFGGYGHPEASGAYVDSYVPVREIIERIRAYLEQKT